MLLGALHIPLEALHDPPRHFGLDRDVPVAGDVAANTAYAVQIRDPLLVFGVIGIKVEAHDRRVEREAPFEDVVRERMLGRAREDDTPEAIDKRLALYAAETVPVIDFFDGLDLLVVVDGLGSPEEVTARLVAAIDERLAERA